MDNVDMIAHTEVDVDINTIEDKLKLRANALAMNDVSHKLRVVVFISLVNVRACKRAWHGNNKAEPSNQLTYS